MPSPSGGGSQTVTQVQGPPPEFIPWIEDAFKEAQKVAALPYVPYEGQRIAEFVPIQQQVQRELMQYMTPEQYETAMAGAQGAGAMGFDVAQRGLGSGMAGAERTGMTGERAAQMGLQRALGFTPGTFGRREAGYYMSPYQQAVTDTTLREAQRAADIERRNIGLQAAARGTVGGSAEALQRAELARNLATQRSDIQARGSQAAFENAQQQFERDRAAAATAAGLGAQVGGGALGSAIQSYLGLGGFGQAGLGTSLQSALGLGELAGAKQRADLSRLEAQRVIGQQIQDQNQRVLQQQYADFLAQRGYPREQIAFYLDALRGTAPLFGQVTQTTQPGPSAAQQLVGAGLAGLGAYKALA